ncbi:hypothetical protein FSP39_012271 [Pinctada imbricata]|uniref:Uncharacterized protein n=1 Tax=Pinctada imbricata TaxID=66713 RepID=A0AA89BNF2_PINIB|nr:hypothetical protein FSP39_012271 [Pinctada imbricata]
METVHDAQTRTEIAEAKAFFAQIQSTSKVTGALNLRFQLLETERKFRRACEQILALECKMDDMTSRYEKAKSCNQRNFRYTLRLQLAVVEGVQNVYHDYARIQAEKINELREELDMVDPETDYVTDDEEDMEVSDYDES